MREMKHVIFYSWQSDLATASNHTLIEDALENVINIMKKEDIVSIEPVLDRDTAGVAGSPDISKTIFDKIGGASAFIADVSIINAGSPHRPVPNPNVLVELGYALRALGDNRVILILNDFFGGPEELPFDLRTRRAIRYSSDPSNSDRATPRKALEIRLKGALELILQNVETETTVARPAYQLRYRYEWHPTKVESDLHEYVVAFYIKNEGSLRATDYRFQVDFPTDYLYDSDKGNGWRAFVFNQDQYRGNAQIIYPDEERVAFRIQYYVNTRNYSEERMADKKLRISLYSGDMAPLREELPFIRIQHF